MHKDQPDIAGLRQMIAELEEDAYWQEEFRLIDQYKQAIRDQLGREPTWDDILWYIENQSPDQRGQNGS